MLQPASVTLLRLPQVLHRMQVSRSAWYKGIANGIYPRPIKWGGSSRWFEAEIDKLIQDAADARKKRSDPK